MTDSVLGRTKCKIDILYAYPGGPEALSLIRAAWPKAFKVLCRHDGGKTVVKEDAGLFTIHEANDDEDAEPSTRVKAMGARINLAHDYDIKSIAEIALALSSALTLPPRAHVPVLIGNIWAVSAYRDNIDEIVATYRSTVAL